MQETSSVITETTVESSGPIVAGLPDEIKEFLKSVHEMSIGEDWSECDVQDLATRGGELYKKYARQ